MAGIVASLVTLGNLPLLAFITIYVRLVSANARGEAAGGDALGLAIMSMLAYGLALLSLVAGAVFFGYQRMRHQKRPGAWHTIVLAGSAFALIIPPIYFLF